MRDDPILNLESLVPLVGLFAMIGTLQELRVLALTSTWILIGFGTLQHGRCLDLS
jgi:hypothetical protein